MTLSRIALKLIASLSLGLLAVVPGAANATVITFEGVVPDSGMQQPVLPYTEQGYTFTTSVEPGNNADAIVGKDAGANNNGSATLIFCSIDGGCSRNAMLTLTGPAGFSITSIDAGNYVVGTPAGTLELIGNLVGGGTISRTINADNSFETFALSGFSNLSSLLFIGHTATGISIDNLIVSDAAASVPEPGTLLLGGLAALGLLASRRRAIQK